MNSFSLKQYEVGNVVLRCSDNCEALIVDKYSWGKDEDTGEEDIDYNVAMVSSNVIDDINTFWSRLKRAFKILFGETVYHTSMYIEKEEDLIKFRDSLTELIEKR